MVGHLVDPLGIRQKGSAGKGRLEGRNRDFLALGGWRRGGTSGSAAVGFRHLYKRRTQESQIRASTGGYQYDSNLKIPFAQEEV